MAAPKKRVFVSFAIEDQGLRNLLVGQRLNPDTPFEWQDFSVKEPWDSKWKTNCRTRIRGCHGVIGIITRNTPKADGQIWELECTIEEKISLLLIYGTDDRPALPSFFVGRRICTWNWEDIATFMQRL